MGKTFLGRPRNNTYFQNLKREKEIDGRVDTQTQITQAQNT